MLGANSDLDCKIFTYCKTPSLVLLLHSKYRTYSTVHYVQKSVQQD